MSAFLPDSIPLVEGLNTFVSKDAIYPFGHDGFLKYSSLVKSRYTDIRQNERGLVLNPKASHPPLSQMKVDLHSPADLMKSATSSCNLVFKSKADIQNKEYRGVIIGDSQNYSGATAYWMDRTAKRLGAKKCRLFGTKTATVYDNGPHTIKHECHPGASSDNFLTQSSWTNRYGTFENHMIAPDGSFEFARLIPAMGGPTIRFVIIALGTNPPDTPGLFNAKTEAQARNSIDQIIDHLDQMANSVHAYNSSIQVGIPTLAIPGADQDAWGAIYRIHPTLDFRKWCVFEANKAITEHFRGHANTSIIPIGHMLNPHDDYPLEGCQGNFTFNALDQSVTASPFTWRRFDNSFAENDQVRFEAVGQSVVNSGQYRVKSIVGSKMLLDGPAIIDQSNVGSCAAIKIGGGMADPIHQHGKGERTAGEAYFAWATSVGGHL